MYYNIEKAIYFLRKNNYKIDISVTEIEKRLNEYLDDEDYEFIINNINLLIHEIVETNEIINKYGKILYPQDLERGSWTLRKITEFHYLAMKYELLYAKYNKDIEHLNYRSTKVPNRFINNKIISIFNSLDIDIKNK